MSGRGRGWLTSATSSSRCGTVTRRMGRAGPQRSWRTLGRTSSPSSASIRPSEHAITTEWPGGEDQVDQRAVDRLERRRAKAEARPASGSAKASQRDWWIPAGETEFEPLRLEDFAGWMLDPFVRYDGIARRYQRLSRLASSWIPVLAAAGAVALATQAIFAPARPRFVFVEVLALVVAGAWFAIARRLCWHELWISYRHLAERLRSMFFLAVAGKSADADVLTGGAALASGRGAPSEGWISSKVTVIALAQPKIVVGEDEVSPLRRYLALHWIEDQARYHWKSTRRHRSSDARYGATAFVVFLAALALSVLHFAGVFQESSLPAKLLVTVAIAIPTIGAAMSGVVGSRDDRRHAARSVAMAQRLRGLRRDMESADTLDEVRAVAVETASVMREEAGDWFGEMRFQDVEPPAG